MLDPLTALSIATAIVQFVDFGCKIVDTGRSLYKLSDGATGANKTLEEVNNDLAAHTEKLGKSIGINGVPLSDQDKGFERLRTKCLDLAKDLQKKLNDLKVKDSHHGILRGWTSLRKAFKAVASESRIREMTKQLESYRQEIALKDLKQRQKAFKEESFRNQLLMRDLMFRDVSQKIDDMMAASSRLATKADILDKLYFPDMGERHARIKPAHVKTFSWILDDHETHFRSWLESKPGVFWVRGKAGSGKSTLMKYIAGHVKVDQLLQKWAGPTRLIKAMNYLWSPGSAMQKSLEGLMQSLLFQILSETPDAIPLALPERWRATSGSYTYRQPWTKEELNKALRMVMTISQDVKYFFFIDGLDEYWGDLEEISQDLRPTAGTQRPDVSLEDVHPRAKADQRALVELIQALGRFSNVKLCVSSRPWNAFQEASGQVPDRMLNLADLTKEDMRQYTESMLMDDERFAALAKQDLRARQLIVDIRDKAQGVFLWVCLVVASLLRGLTNRDGIDELRKRLFSFPSDLRAFFNDILHTIDESYRTMTCRMLKLAKYDAPLPVMAFWWLKYEHDNPSYAEMGKMQAIGDLGPQLTADASRHVNKWCHDLLEVRQIAAGSKIDFLHRTVRDFLVAEDVTGFLAKHAGKDFDERLSMCRLQLAEAKTLPVLDRRNGESFQRIAFDIMRHAKAVEVGKGQSPITILHELDSTGKRYHGLSKVSHWTNELPVNASGYGPGDIQLNTHQGHSNFLSFAVSQDLLLYVERELDADSSLLNKIGRPLLDYAIHRTFSKPNERDQDILVDMTQILLRKGANPNAHAHLWGTVSIWEAFLYNCYRGWDKPGTRRVAELLLEYGAQTGSVVIESHSLQGKIMSASARECLERSFSLGEVDEILGHYRPSRSTFWSRWFPLWNSS
ncbi:hypothetical protein PRZ48_003483 [Zasmidium cellare]|uniref:NACHT domain-containing protein n=1 Tax=Zasmidium cellare TaxID=395010 RepID=A0ABR0EVQ9_ZASCE|nr:hypothetical protein PRZ48_003483 [Zasmidium cellare]